MSIAIPERIVEAMLALATRAWRDGVVSKAIRSGMKENEIADELSDFMKKKKRADRMDRIRIEREYDVKYGPNGKRGRIDIVAVYSFEEEEYFGIECKRVAGGDVSLARAYAEEGVRRFVTGKYSNGHDLAAMLGFVIDGDCDGSASLLEPKVNAEKVIDRWARCAEYGTHPHTYSSKHDASSGALRLLHLLLST